MGIFNRNFFKTLNELKIDGEVDEDDYTIEPDEEEEPEDDAVEDDTPPAAPGEVGEPEDDDPDLADTDYNMDDEPEDDGDEPVALDDDTAAPGDPEPATEENPELDDTNYDLPDDDIEGGDTNEETGENTDDDGGLDNTDYSMDSDAGAEGDTEGGGDPTENDGAEAPGGDPAADPASADPSTQEEEAARNLENQIYETLSADQKKIKELELKSAFKDIFTSCDRLATSVNGIPKTDTNLEVVKRVVSTLTNLKEFVLFYVENSFNNKTFIENNIVFYKYLYILKGVEMVLQQLAPEDSKS